MRVAVIGAGLGGLTLAHGLRQAGIDVVVYERDAAPGRRQGISLHLDDRGASALRACLPPAHVAMTLTLSDVDGALTVVGVRPSDGEAGRPRPGRQVHRPLLRAVLLTELDDIVRWGAEFRQYEQDADGTVRVRFADGSTDSADVLVGADGIGSVVRLQHLPSVRVVDTGRRMIMGATPLGAAAGTGLPHLIGHNPASAQVRGTTMAMGVLRFTQSPLAARRQWLSALPHSAVAALDDYVMWALPVTQEQLGSAPVWRSAKHLAANLPSPLRSIVTEGWPDVTVALRIGTIPPPPAWPASAVTLIGDAIHLAPGFGGNLAMQDAHSLCQVLVDAHRGRRHVISAIGAYEDTMRYRSFPAATATATA
jgi:2-polyprenyl-6-methoxyphenol hydroxylase-like FAD-dependent oxidoreductase